MSASTPPEILPRIRFTAARLIDVANSEIRQIGIAIVAQIDAEMKRHVPDPVGWQSTIDPAEIPTDVLLAEVSRRIRAVRRVAKLCGRCGGHKARAKGLCMQCYQQARKQAKRRE